METWANERKRKKGEERHSRSTEPRNTTGCCRRRLTSPAQSARRLQGAACYSRRQVIALTEKVEGEREKREKEIEREIKKGGERKKRKNPVQRIDPCGRGEFDRRRPASLFPLLSTWADYIDNINSSRFIHGEKKGAEAKRGQEAHRYYNIWSNSCDGPAAIRRLLSPSRHIPPAGLRVHSTKIVKQENQNKDEEENRDGRRKRARVWRRSEPSPLQNEEYRLLRKVSSSRLNGKKGSKTRPKEIKQREK